MSVPLSVVVITKNEEKRIDDCLASVAGWAEEIIVVDDVSSDRTLERASKYTNKLLTRPMDIEGRHRNWAYAQASFDWVLSLDADERVTDGLKKEIEELFGKPLFHCAFSLRRRNHIGDYWVKWSGQYPSPQIKLVNRNKFKWEEAEVHPRAILDGSCGRVDGDLLHFSYRNWSDFLRKLDKQTAWEAQKWYKLSLTDPGKARYKMNLGHAVWRMVDRFVRTFIVKRGYRDGFIGFMFAYFAALYQMVSYAKFWEMKRNEGSIPRP